MHCGGYDNSTPLQSCEMLNSTTQQYELLPQPPGTFSGSSFKLAARASSSLVFMGNSNPAGTVYMLEAGATNWTTMQLATPTTNGVGLCTFDNDTSALAVGGQYGETESLRVCCGPATR